MSRRKQECSSKWGGNYVNPAISMKKKSVRVNIATFEAYKHNCTTISTSSS